MKKEKLESYVGQLQDLESGFIEEIIIKKGEDAKLLKEVIQEMIKQVNDFLSYDEYMSKLEKLEDEEYARRADWDILNEKNRNSLSL